MEKFEDLINSETPVLIDFYATWCAPCRNMHSVLEELKKEKGEKLRIAKIDVDRHESLAAEQHIQSIPTLMLYKHGNLIWRQSGFTPLVQLKEVLEKYL
ncbi:MAG: thioredoxin [Bacteroidaceae bacterium]|nr:thioredoxin [Bacteroidaceae bacterium]